MGEEEEGEGVEEVVVAGPSPAWLVQGEANTWQERSVTVIARGAYYFEKSRKLRKEDSTYLVLSG